MHRFVSGRLLILVPLLLTLEYAFASSFPFLKGRPNLISLLILDYAFFWSGELVPFFALGLGLVRDAVGGHLFGIETVSLTVSGFLLHVGVQKLERENPWVRLGMGFLFVGFAELLSLGLGSWLETSKAPTLDLIGSVFLTTIYTTALGPGFFWFTNRWFKRAPNLMQYELFQ